MKGLLYWYKIYAIAVVMVVPIVLLIGLLDTTYAFYMGWGVLFGFFTWPPIMNFLYGDGVKTGR